MTRYVVAVTLAAGACLGGALSAVLPPAAAVLHLASRWLLAAALVAGIGAAAHHGYEVGREPVRVRSRD